MSGHLNIDMRFLHSGPSNKLKVSHKYTRLKSEFMSIWGEQQDPRVIAGRGRPMARSVRNGTSDRFSACDQLQMRTNSRLARNFTILHLFRFFFQIDTTRLHLTSVA